MKYNIHIIIALVGQTIFLGGMESDNTRRWELYKKVNYRQPVVSIQLNKNKEMFDIYTGKASISDKVRDYIMQVSKPGGLKIVSASQKLFMMVSGAKQEIFTSNMQKLISSSGDTIEIFDLQKQKRVIWSRDFRDVRAGYFSACDRYCAINAQYKTSGRYNDTFIFHLSGNSMSHIKTITPAIPIRAMAVDNNKNYCLLGSKNSELFIVDMKRDKIVKQHLSGGDCVAACFDDTGECFAVGSALGHVYMFTLSDEADEAKEDSNFLQSALQYK